VQRVLVVTVGGSPHPVINACREFQPDFTYFVCSKGRLPHGSEDTVDGPGDPCGDKRTQKCPECSADVPLGNPKGKAIVYQVNISPHAYAKKVVEDPDDLEEVYGVMLSIHHEVKQRFPNATKAISYTGGTKNMTVGAVLLGLHYPEWQLAINKGPRRDLIKVTQGDSWWPINISSIYAKGQLQAYIPLLERYEYNTVQELLRPLQMNPSLPNQERARLYRLRQFCTAFDAWDRFDHQEALSRLEALGGRAGPWIRLAKNLVGVLPKGNPYQAVADLVLNAARRVKQGGYDDAVARLYRAVEMLAQVRLKEMYEVNTGKVDLGKVPAECRSLCEAAVQDDGEIRLPLVRSYELLACLKDELGRLWREQESRVKNALRVRNFSILAHGNEVIRETHYRECGTVFENFIKQGLEVCQVKPEWHQLPTAELLEM